MYIEGKHDDPADTKDRLARIGAKYQATPPVVADGDNAHFLVSAEGRPRIEEYMIQQSRLGNLKNTQGSITKTTQADETIASWTVTNGKTGYLSAAFVTYESHASETRHTIKFFNDTTTIHRIYIGRGDQIIYVPFPVPHKLVGDGSKTFKLDANQATVNSSVYEATLLGWEE